MCSQVTAFVLIIGPRKTAALLEPTSPGSKVIRRQVFSVGGGQLPVLREQGPGLWLSVVSKYRHLGSTLTFNGSLVDGDLFP